MKFLAWIVKYAVLITSRPTASDEGKYEVVCTNEMYRCHRYHRCQLTSQLLVLKKKDQVFFANFKVLECDRKIRFSIKNIVFAVQKKQIFAVSTTAHQTSFVIFPSYRLNPLYPSEQDESRKKRSKK